MANDSPPVRIRAFVGRSFLEQDDPVWYAIRTILASLRPIGFDFEDAKEAQLRPISEKVREGIERNDFYIGILTRRSRINDQATESNLGHRFLARVLSRKASQWTTSNWIVQESGFALGKGKKVLLLIEQGVDFPAADLDADTEWVPFNRDSVPECANRLVSMIGRLISETLPATPATVQVSSPEKGAPSEERRPEPPPGGDIDHVIELLNKGEYSQADEEFERFVGPGGDP